MGLYGFAQGSNGVSSNTNAVRKMQHFSRKNLFDSSKEKLLAWKPDFLIPVPLHRHRRWFRGYNQAEILAEEIGKRLHLPVETDVLCRSLDTSPQKQLDDKVRYRNMSSAFYVPESASYKLNGKRVVLIDDIYTTGSTLEACAGELKKAGVSEIYSACLCIGRDY